MALIVKRYKYTGVGIPALRDNTDPNAVVAIVGDPILIDVSFDDSVVDETAVDAYVVQHAYVPNS